MPCKKWKEQHLYHCVSFSMNIFMRFFIFIAISILHMSVYFYISVPHSHTTRRSMSHAVPNAPGAPHGAPRRSFARWTSPRLTVPLRQVRSGAESSGASMWRVTSVSGDGGSHGIPQATAHLGGSVERWGKLTTETWWKCFRKVDLLGGKHR